MGFSVRKSRKVVNARFIVSSGPSVRGEVVEIPGGTFRARFQEGRRRSELRAFRHPTTGKLACRLVTFPGGRRVVRFNSGKNLDLTPAPLPPLQLTTEEAQCRHLISELMGGRPAGDVVMRILDAALHEPLQARGTIVAPTGIQGSRQTRHQCLHPSRCHSRILLDLRTAGPIRCPQLSCIGRRSELRSNASPVRSKI
jgi:hypothetical protein